MFSLLTFLIGAIFTLSKSKKELIIQLFLHKKELEILKRQNQKKRLKFKHYDRIIFSILNRIGISKETVAERFVGSERQEALDYYLLISEKQIMRILREYIDYYNSKRPQQGIDQRIPIGYKPQLHGRVLKFPIPGGLCNHCIRSVA